MDPVTLGMAKADAKRKYAPVTLASDQWVPLGYRARPPFNSSGNQPSQVQSNGTNLGATFKMMDTAQITGRDICVEFAMYLNVDGESELGNDVTITRVVWSPANGTNIPLLFNGSPSVTIKSGTFGVFKVRSDPLGVMMEKGTEYSILVNVSVPPGGKYPTHLLARRGNFEEGAGQGGAVTAGPGTDYTAPGQVWTAEPGSIRMFGPSAILTRPAKPSRVALLLTDSTGVGTGESIVPSNAHWDEGWFTRAVRGRWPHYVVGMSGMTVQKWFSTDQLSSFRRKSVISGVHFTDIVTSLGGNDLSIGASLSQIQGYWLTAWRQMAAYGRPLYQTTILPRAITSTDSWTTVAGQTPSPLAATCHAANAWLRDGAPMNISTGAAVAVGATGSNIARAGAYLTNVAGAASVSPKAGAAGHPLAGVIEVTDAVETARDSGVVKVLSRSRSVTDGAMTAGSPTLTSASAAFSAADVGRLIHVVGAGTAGGTLISTIASVASATSATLAGNAVTSASGATVRVSPHAYTADGIHPSGTAGPEPGGHEAVANWARPILASILGPESV